MTRLVLPLLALAAVAMIASAAAPTAAPPPAPQSSSGHRVFELRTYYTNEGKMQALHRRFRDHTNELFRKHGMTIVGFWEPQDAKDGKGDKLIYMLAFPDRKAAEASWKAFREDPEWVKVKAESEKNGVLVKKVDSVFMDPTDYSPMK